MKTIYAVLQNSYERQIIFSSITDFKGWFLPKPEKNHQET